jgi:hypothetical protein
MKNLNNRDRAKDWLETERFFRAWLEVKKIWIEN